MSNINDNLDSLFNKLQGFISSKTVVGEAITVGKTTLIPFVDISIGMGVGSSQKKGDKSGEAGAGGFGAKMKPTAVLVVGEHGVQMVSVENESGMSKLIDMVPGLISKVEGFVSGGKDDDTDEEY